MNTEQTQPPAVVLSTAQLGGWIACVDRLPDIPGDAIVSDDVLGGCWITDNWLRDGHPKKQRFIFGACSVRRADDLREFPQGKQWHTFGPSHNQITHWCEVIPPNAEISARRCDGLPGYRADFDGEM